MISNKAKTMTIHRVSNQVRQTPRHEHKNLMSILGSYRRCITIRKRHEEAQSKHIASTPHTRYDTADVSAHKVMIVMEDGKSLQTWPPACSKKVWVMMIVI